MHLPEPLMAIVIIVFSVACIGSLLISIFIRNYKPALLAPIFALLITAFISGSAYEPTSQPYNVICAELSESVATEEPTVNTTPRTTNNPASKPTPKSTLEPVPEQSIKPESNETLVYVTEYGEKYHYSFCKYVVGKDCTEFTISSAQSSGYEPCKICKQRQGVK